MAEQNTEVRNNRIFKKKKRRKSSGGMNSNKFSVIESYKTIRTNLQFSLKKKGGNVLLVTSTMPRDGKSTVVANIAVAFSQTDINVLIIDCDMRKPRVNKFFNVSAIPGLSNFLAGLCDINDAIQDTEYKNLSIISSGILPPNPAELLSSSEMEELMEDLRNKYDLIILDSPPVNIVSDAVVATKYTDGVVLIVRHALTTHPEIEKAVKSLEFANAKILGIILNAFDFSKLYGKRYGSYYRAGYRRKGYGKYGYGGYGNYGGYGYGGYGSYSGYGSYGGYGSNAESSLATEKKHNAAVNPTGESENTDLTKET
jgi:capsular exopolysaccharide synthesis family protein